MVSIRASDIVLALEAPHKISARNIIHAVIDEIICVGARVLIYVNVGERIVAEITPSALLELELRQGQDVYLIVKANSILIMDVNSGD